MAVSVRNARHTRACTCSRSVILESVDAANRPVARGTVGAKLLLNGVAFRSYDDPAIRTQSNHNRARADVIALVGPKTCRCRSRSRSKKPPS